MTKYRVTIDYDYDAENPNDSSLVKLVSFSTRHTDYTHPDAFLAECSECDGFGIANDKECSKCEGSGEGDGEWSEDVLATLSYYEHGECRWMVGESVIPDHGGFDTVGIAGVLVWNGEDSEREWWGGLDENVRTKALEAHAVEYTDWANGHAYWFDVSEVEACGECGTDKGIPTDAGYGGIVGSDYLRECVATELAGLGVTTEDVTYAGEAAHCR